MFACFAAYAPFLAGLDRRCGLGSIFLRVSLGFCSSLVSTSLSLAVFFGVSFLLCFLALICLAELMARSMLLSCLDKSVVMIINPLDWRRSPGQVRIPGQAFFVKMLNV